MAEATGNDGTTSRNDRGRPGEREPNPQGFVLDQAAWWLWVAASHGVVGFEMILGVSLRC
jgi:hypothetical protein